MRSKLQYSNPPSSQTAPVNSWSMQIPLLRPVEKVMLAGSEYSEAEWAVAVVRFINLTVYELYTTTHQNSLISRYTQWPL